MKTAYPMFFTLTNSGEYLICSPDIPSAKTQGENLYDAILMARDVLSLCIVTMEDNNEEIPKPSNIEELDVSKGIFSNEGSTIISFVDIDTEDYRKKINQQAVRRNVALPGWLDYQANKSGINVSRLLQDALIEKLNLK